MSSPEREIPQRELRNHISKILQEVAAGSRLRVTVNGRPVADLIPVGEGRRFVSRADVERLLREAPLDSGFASEIEVLAGATIEEL